MRQGWDGELKLISDCSPSTVRENVVICFLDSISHRNKSGVR